MSCPQPDNTTVAELQRQIDKQSLEWCLQVLRAKQTLDEKNEHVPCEEELYQWTFIQKLEYKMNILDKAKIDKLEQEFGDWNWEISEDELRSMKTNMFMFYQDNKESLRHVPRPKYFPPDYTR